jgi:hypothetical protein
VFCEVNEDTLTIDVRDGNRTVGVSVIVVAPV